MFPPSAVFGTTFCPLTVAEFCAGILGIVIFWRKNNEVEKLLKALNETEDQDTDATAMEPQLHSQASKVSELNSELAALASKYEAARQRLVSELKASQLEVNSQSELITSLHQNLQLALVEVQAKNRISSSLEAELENLKKEEKTNHLDVQRLSSELESAQMEVHRQSRLINSLEKDLEQALVDIQAKSQLVSDLETELNHARKHEASRLHVESGLEFTRDEVAPQSQSITSLRQIDAMSVEERTKKASEYKAEGNAAYTAKNLARAVELYTQAIRVAPKADAVYYCNRAACYINVTPPKHELVIADCDEALKLDSAYVKALNRRALALEGVERYEEALRVERVLKKLAAQKAAEILASRGPRLPSFNFVKAYFSAFRPRPQPAFPETLSQGDQTLKLALDASDFVHALSFINEAIEQGISFPEGKAEALNLRGTFKFLTGDVEGAKNDLLESIVHAPSFTQSLVKLASVYMELGDPKKAFECFDEAISHNPNDPDIYYHKGQVLFIMNEFTDAAENYTKSMELDDKFVFSHIQLAVAQYKSGNLANSMATFRRTLKAFPQRSEPHSYYGELLLDQQRFQDAVEKFDKAFELEKAKEKTTLTLPVLPVSAERLPTSFLSSTKVLPCSNGNRISTELNDALNLQQGKIAKAVEMFDKQVQLARSEPELNNALTYKYASEAQVDFQKNFPAMAAQLHQLAHGMF
ncbi:hypothetical protein JOM56_005257 [Amanita muscaria]